MLICTVKMSSHLVRSVNLTVTCHSLLSPVISLSAVESHCSVCHLVISLSSVISLSPVISLLSVISLSPVIFTVICLISLWICHLICHLSSHWGSVVSPCHLSVSLSSDRLTVICHLKLSPGHLTDQLLGLTVICHLSSHCHLSFSLSSVTAH